MRALHERTLQSVRSVTSAFAAGCLQCIRGVQVQDRTRAWLSMRETLNLQTAVRGICSSARWNQCAGTNPPEVADKAAGDDKATPAGSQKEQVSGANEDKPSKPDPYKFESLSHRDPFPNWKSSVEKWTKRESGVRWWDRHMSQGAQNVEAITAASVLVEIRDARIPRTSVHPLFEKWRMERGMDHVVVYTHSDLLQKHELAQLKKWSAEYVAPPENTFFKDVSEYKNQKRKNFHDLIDQIGFLMLHGASRFKGAGMTKAIVCGIPNVGKSSLIYILTKDLTKEVKKKKLYHAPKIENVAGKTRVLKQHWLNVDPNLMMVDTPGMFLPPLTLERNPEAYYKLAITWKLNSGSLNNHRDVLQYLLYRLNRARLFDYVKFYKMTEPTDDVNLFIKSAHPRTPTPKAALQPILGHFLFGSLGKLCLDDIESPLPKMLLNDCHYVMNRLRGDPWTEKVSYINVFNPFS
ncbi:Mitochondrial ribosome-associated GTPase 1 [Porphyridium purpureum]|uniref:Mitochondrial ribosome-associated GTPase 1 n=1 Tax=Porphyridium purpureum TaxID=35688 RepID=A0A5J4Z7T6_PORPP|nr:Mitochondrial ribosome-associated GTPase 1 [Porphyridium purpureum]|eukprot:POR8118..scf295_1